MQERIYLYKIDTDYMSREESHLMELLPEWRKEKAKRFKVSSAKYESMAAGRLLDIALADYIGVGVSEIHWSEADTEEELGRKVRKKDQEDEIIEGIEDCIEICTDTCIETCTEICIEEKNSENHKLKSQKFFYIHHFDTSQKKVYYNISHSGEFVVVAVAEEPVGIDIEFKDDKNFRISDRMFAEEDKAYISDSQDRFRDVWTIKESYLKCIGIGIVVPLGEFTSDYNEIGSEHPASIISKVQETSETGYYTRTTRLKTDKSDYSLSICMKKSNLVLDIKTVEVLI